MSNPCIIPVAITGALPTKLDTPAVPVTPSEQIESTHEAYEAGASLVHIHVRNQDQTPSSDPDKYHQVQQGVSKHCPGMIIQFSTGGRGRDQSLRAGMLHHRPDMASLATDSVNFPMGIYENPADFVEGLAAEMQKYKVKPEIEVFDAAMLYNAANLVKKGLLDPPVHLQFVLGIPNALPARRSLLEFLIAETSDILPNATWGAAGIGRYQFEVNQWCLELGGHCRTGLEDNIKFAPDRLAASNAELVGKIVDIAGEYNRYPASPIEARKILDLGMAEQGGNQ
jgi:3-keto-5-aminohexanoate cleavage enzyme